MISLCSFNKEFLTSYFSEQQQLTCNTLYSSLSNTLCNSQPKTSATEKISCMLLRSQNHRLETQEIVEVKLHGWSYQGSSQSLISWPFQSVVLVQRIDNKKEKCKVFEVYGYCMIRNQTSLKPFDSQTPLLNALKSWANTVSSEVCKMEKIILSSHFSWTSEMPLWLETIFLKKVALQISTAKASTPCLEACDVGANAGRKRTLVNVPKPWWSFWTLLSVQGWLVSKFNLASPRHQASQRYY